MALNLRAWVLAACGGLGFLSGCASGLPPGSVGQMDGMKIALGETYRYDVVPQALSQALGGETLRVTRIAGPGLTYSDGLAAKKAAEAYCAGQGKALHPGAFGAFSMPASWLFEGGCL